MGQIKKIGDEYYIEFYARGLLYQQKAGPDKVQAERLLNDIESKIVQGEAATIVRDVDVDIFFKTFLENAAVEHTPKTLGRYQDVTSHFVQFLPRDIQKLSSITPRVIEDYRAHLWQQNPQALNFNIFLLRDIFDYSIKLGYLNDNPTLHIKFLNQEYSPALNKKVDLAKDFISRGVSFSKLYRLLELDDISKTACYIPFYFERSI